MNKKIWIIIAIVAVLLIAAIVGGTILIINLTKNKEPITASEFKDIMEDADFEVINSKDQFANVDEIEDSMIAVQKDEDYQI